MAESPETDQPTIKRKIAIPFYSAVGATTGIGLSTDRITFPYRVIKVQAHFRDDAANNLQVWAFVSRNPNVGTAPPPDNKILGFYSPTPYLIGEGEIVSVDCDVLPDPQEQFIKVFFWNFNAYAMTGYCIVTIETQEGVSPEQPQIIVNAGDPANYTPEQWLEMAQRKARAITQLDIDVAEGTSPLYQDTLNTISERNTSKSQSLYERFGSLANFTNAIPSTIPKADILKTVAEWVFGVINIEWETDNNFFLNNMIVQALGGNSFDFAKWIEDIYGLKSIVHEITGIGMKTAIFPQVEKYWNKFYTPLTPSQNELINMVVKEKLTVDEFKVYMRENGFSEEWSQLIWDAHFIAPDFETAKRAYWRGGITREELPDFLKLVDLDPKFNEQVWLKLVEEVPQYNDLINMRVKEVISQETFRLGLEAQGYYGDWATRLWDAHFTPASFTDFLTAMRRKKTVSVPVAEGQPISHTFGADAGRDLEIIRQLSILADYDPRYWDFFETRMYNDPSYRMIMWGYESGAIPLDRVPDLVHRLGLNPVDESWYQQFITTFQERPWITRYLTALQTAYTQNAITEEDLRSRVRAIPRNENIATWMVRIANVRREIASSGTVQEQQKLITDAELKQGYILGLISQDDFRSRLLAKGYNLIDVDLMIAIIDKQNEIADVGGKKEGLTVAEYFDAWRYGELSQDELTTALLVKGLNLDQINILIETKKKKWGVGGVETQLS